MEALYQQGSFNATDAIDSYVHIYSHRLESNGIWSTSKTPDIKQRGYIEVRTTFPATARSENIWKYKGAWPAVWLLGTGGGWPKVGEIDIVESVNGQPSIVVTTHSTNHHGGNGQHPPKNPFYMTSDFTNGQYFLTFSDNNSSCTNVSLSAILN